MPKGQGKHIITKKQKITCETQIAQCRTSLRRKLYGGGGNQEEFFF